MFASILEISWRWFYSMEKTAVIVGVGRELGRSIARAFGKRGFWVWLVARQEEELKVLREELAAEQIRADIETADAGNVESLTAAFTRIREKIPWVDVLVYNETVMSGGRPAELTNQTVMEHFQVDVASALHCANLVLPDMLKRQDGAILFTGGGFALYPMPEYTCMSMDKAAIRALATALSGEVRERGVYVGTVTIMSCVAPGSAYDPDRIAEEYWKLYEKKSDIEYIYR